MNRLATLILAATAALYAQTNPLIAPQKAAYNSVKNNLLKAADKMPEEAYSFKPTPELQDFGQRVASFFGPNDHSAVGAPSGIGGVISGGGAGAPAVTAAAPVQGLPASALTSTMPREFDFRFSTA